jgi:hypothetical protein
LVFIARRWQGRKVKPAWHLRSQTPLMLAGLNGSALIVLDDDDEEAKRPFLHIIRFGNRGTAEILARDFDGSVKVSFKQSNLIGAAIHDSLGLGTAVSFERKGNAVLFTPALLKKDEWIELQLLTDGVVEVPALKARLTDQGTEMVELSYSVETFWAFSQFMSGFFFFAFMALYPFMPATTQGIAALLWFVSVIWFLIASKQKLKSPSWKKDPKPFARL